MSLSCKGSGHPSGASVGKLDSMPWEPYRRHPRHIETVSARDPQMEDNTPHLEVTVSANAVRWCSMSFLLNKWISKSSKIMEGHGLGLAMFRPDRPSPVETPLDSFDAKGQSPRSWVCPRLHLGPCLHVGRWNHGVFKRTGGRNSRLVIVPLCPPLGPRTRSVRRVGDNLS